MVIINVEYPSSKELQWLADNIGERLSYLPHYIGGKGWRYRRNYINYTDATSSEYKIQWTLEFDDDKMVSYYILRFK
jgi:hypothetical protein